MVAWLAAKALPFLPSPSPFQAQGRREVTRMVGGQGRPTDQPPSIPGQAWLSRRGCPLVGSQVGRRGPPPLLLLPWLRRGSRQGQAKGEVGSPEASRCPLARRWTAEAQVGLPSRFPPADSASSSSWFSGKEQF